MSRVTASEMLSLLASAHACGAMTAVTSTGHRGTGPGPAGTSGLPSVITGLTGLEVVTAILLDPATKPASVKAACALITQLATAKDKKENKDKKKKTKSEQQEQQDERDERNERARAIRTPGLVRTLCLIASRDPNLGSESSAALCALGILPARKLAFSAPQKACECLSCSCEAQDSDAVLLALRSGTEPRCSGGSVEMSPLAMSAYTATDPHVMRLLLAHGADPNGVDPEGLTPLHWASTKEAAQILLSHGADPRIKNSAGLTALEYHRALEMRETEVTRFLALRAKLKPEPTSDPKAKRARTS